MYQSFKALLLMKINRGLQTRITSGTSKAFLKIKTSVRPYSLMRAWLLNHRYSEGVPPVKATFKTSESISLEVFLYPLFPSVGARNRPGKTCSSAPSMQSSPLFLHGASAATRIMGPKPDVPTICLARFGHRTASCYICFLHRTKSIPSMRCLHFGYRRHVPGCLMGRDYNARDSSTGT